MALKADDQHVPAPAVCTAATLACAASSLPKQAQCVRACGRAQCPELLQQLVYVILTCLAWQRRNLLFFVFT